MLPFLEKLQQSLGLVGLTLAALGVGVVLGFLAGLFVRRRPAVAPAPPSAPAKSPSAAVDVFADSEEAKEKRRNPRRPGRSVEVFVFVAGSSEPTKGVVLDRSVGGLKLLVGDEYPVGSIIGVLPAAASKLTPWVEVEVKACHRSGDDWEIGVQFQKLPPYSTMVLFG